MRRLLAIGLLATAVLAGCGGEEEPAASAATATPAATATATPAPAPTRSAAAGRPRRRGTVIATGASQFGTVLFDGRRQAIYLFDKERTERPRCYGACAEAWPPVLSKGAPVARGRVRRGLLGTTRRRDGTLQVTYNGHPLYYYAHEGPGEVKCHKVPGFGGLWLALAPDGDRVS